MNWVDRRPESRRSRLLRRSEVADMLGVTPNTVSRWAREGRLPSVATLGGHRRYEVEVVEELMKRAHDEPSTRERTPEDPA
ncbi:MAG: helix-turn-helix domain-containing protein [Acidobacteria bacterium]|nr:helix-turn-helix domain-containing protein [Acidobacteriota bacterium]